MPTLRPRDSHDEDAVGFQTMQSEDILQRQLPPKALVSRTVKKTQTRDLAEESREEVEKRSVTVEQLIRILEDYPSDTTVLISVKFQGDAVMHIEATEEYVFRDNGHSVEVGFDKLDEKLIEQGYTEEDVIIDGRKAVVLYP